jgi:hypothetical protein
MSNLRFIALLLLATHLALWGAFLPAKYMVDDLSSETEAEYIENEQKMSVLYENRIIPITASVVAVVLSTAFLVLVGRHRKSVTKRRWVWDIIESWSGCLLVTAVGLLVMTTFVFYTVASLRTLHY